MKFDNFLKMACPCGIDSDLKLSRCENRLTVGEKHPIPCTSCGRAGEAEVYAVCLTGFFDQCPPLLGAAVSN